SAPQARFLAGRAHLQRIRRNARLELLARPSTRVADRGHGAHDVRASVPRARTKLRSLHALNTVDRRRANVTGSCDSSPREAPGANGPGAAPTPARGDVPNERLVDVRRGIGNVRVGVGRGSSDR